MIFSLWTVWDGWTTEHLSQGHNIIIDVSLTNLFIMPRGQMFSNQACLHLVFRDFIIWPALFVFFLFAVCISGGLHAQSSAVIYGTTATTAFLHLKDLIFYNVFHLIYIQGFIGLRINNNNNHRTEWNSIQSVILWVINTIRWLWSGSQMC